MTARTALPLISASQITLFRECQRKWAWKYLEGLQTPQHPAAALGAEVDDTQLQPYLRDGRAFDYSRDSGYIAAAGLAFLPKPQTPGLEVQKHFTMPSPTWIDRQHIGFGYQGYIDLWLPDSSLAPDMPGGAPFVGDFKTTSDLKWAKSKEQLSIDVQAVLYATHAMFATGKKEVDLAWIYFQTRNARKAKRTHLRVVSDQVAEQFEKINETAIKMKRVREEKPHPTQLPPSPSACTKYGKPCPFASRCNLSPAEIIEAADSEANRFANFMGDSEMNTTQNLLADLKLKRAAQVQDPVANVASTPGRGNAGSIPVGTSALAPPSPLPAQPSLEQHIAENPRAAFLTAPTSAPTPRYAVVGKRPDGSPIYAYELAGTPGPINPPESLLPPAPPVGVAEPKKRGRPAKALAPVPAPVAQTAAAAVAAVNPEADLPANAGQVVVSAIDAAQIAASIAGLLKMQCDALQTYEKIFKRLAGEK